VTLLALPLLLSEVLANEPGSVTSLEFVELVARQSVREGSFILSVNGSAVAVPAVPLDSGACLVVCRDSARFEAHFGDSSGVWGDHNLESYPLQESGFSLPNSTGFVELTVGAEVDRFEWSGNATDGVSYERVGASQTWGRCIASTGSTPGTKNSIDVSYSEGLVVDISPNPFAAGLGQQARIQYQAPLGAVGELRIFRGDGRPVRTLFGRRPVLAGETYWDGAGDTGELVPVGIYIVRFKLFEPRELVHLSTVVVAR